MADQNTEKVKGKTEEFYLESYPDTGLQTGTMILVDPTEMPTEGTELPNGEQLTDEDLAEIAQIVTKTPKKVMQRACAETGDLFWVATSDIHQCRFSRPVREVKRKERAKAKRKVKREAEKARITELEAENETLRQQAG